MLNALLIDSKIPIVFSLIFIFFLNMYLFLVKSLVCLIGDCNEFILVCVHKANYCVVFMTSAFFCTLET